MKNKPPNFRDAECCMECSYYKCIHICGCCPEEYECTKYPSVYIDEYKICDDFKEED